MIEKKIELKCRLQSSLGKKVDLQDQLQKCLDKPRYYEDYLKKKTELEKKKKKKEIQQKKDLSASGLAGFQPSAYWKEINGTI